MCRSGDEDHPRRCGENLNYLNNDNITEGSPPQVRGKQPDKYLLNVGKRITPAGAGKTDLQAMRFRKHEDHPRRCGENLTLPTGRSPKLGSPPQVRGKPPSLYKNTQRRRITPAGAGKTQMKPCCIHRRQDHPRRCGENAFKRKLGFLSPGSPPQVRGKPHTRYAA